MLPGDSKNIEADLAYRSDLLINISHQGEVIIVKNRYGPQPQNGIPTTKEIVELCVTLLSKHLFKNKFNVFKAVFEKDLMTSIERVLGFHGMRTSKKNHRKFSRKMKERNSEERSLENV